MHKRIKRTLAMLLAVIMMVGMLPLSAFAASIGHTVTVTHNIEDVSFLGDNKIESNLSFDTPTDIDNNLLYQCGVKNYWKNVKGSKTLVSVTITSGDASKTIDVSIEEPSDNKTKRISFAADLGIGGSEASLRQVMGNVTIYLKNITACKDDINVTFNWQLDVAPSSQIVLESSGNGVAEKHFKENPTADSSRYELTATPNAGYMLDYWVWKEDGYTSSPETDADNDGYPDANKIINPGDNSAATIDQTITEDRSYKAVFKPAQFIFRYDTVQIKHNATANLGEHAKKYGYYFHWHQVNIEESESIKEFGDAAISLYFAAPSEILPGTKKSIALYKNDERINPFYEKDFIRPDDPSLAIPAGNLFLGIIYEEELEYMETMTVALTLGDVTVYKECSLGAPMIRDPLSQEKTEAIAELKSTYEDCLATSGLSSAQKSLLEDLYKKGKKDIVATTGARAITAWKDEAKEKMANIANGGEADTYVAVAIEAFRANQGLIAKPTLIGICDATKVYSVIHNALKLSYPDMSFENLMKGSDSYISAVYLPGYVGSKSGENYLGEFDVGQNSGWMYTVDGVFPNIGVGEKTVTGGETIRLQYTANNGYDLGVGGNKDALIYTMARLRKDYSDEQLTGTVAENTLTEEQVNAYNAAFELVNKLSADKEDIDTANANLVAAFEDAVLPEKPNPVNDVIKLIDAIGSVDSSRGPAIEAARSAYNALSNFQKILVTNYETLLKAESSYAALTQTSNPSDSQRNAVLAYVKSQAAQPVVGSLGGEWAVLAVARDLGTADHSAWYNAYLSALNAKLNAGDLDGIGGESGKIYTEYARITLALSAMGIDASAYGANDTEYNFVAKLLETENVERQGLNGPIFALLALDSMPYAPENTDIREHYIDYIVGKALADGGWNLNEDATVADVDMTAMAMQALAPYYNTKTAVKAAVDKAITALRNAQDKVAGGFYCWGTYNAESTAQVIVALTSLGIDPTGADWTVNINRNPITALMQFRDAETGGFRHVMNGGVDQMASEQTAYTLVAYDRFLKGSATLYNMSDALDTQIRNVTVKGYKAEAGEGNRFTAELPRGSSLSALSAGDFAITAVSPRANVSAPETTDGGATWTFTLTAPGGMGTASYTINITVSSEQSTEDIAAAKAVVDNIDFTCPMTTANTEDAVKRQIEHKLNSSNLNGVSAAVEMESFSAASAGTASSTSGTAGSFTFTVTLGKGDVSYTLRKTAVITAIPYSASSGSGESENITVSMRLIGAGRSTSDVDLSNSDYLPDYVTWIPTTEYTLPEGSTVYDLFMKATRANGIRSVGAENNYVETIYAPAGLGGYALSEFTNGRCSGWMYTVNGTHPNVGLKYRTLQDGDAVIWHYVNDYRHEVSDWFNDPNYPALGDGTYHNGWLNAEDVAPPAYTPPEDTGKGDGASLAPKAETRNGTATAHVGASDMDKAVENAKKNKSDALTIAPEITGTTSEASVQLPKSSVSDMATGTDADLKVETPVGDVTIPNQALNSVADSAEGSDVVVNIAKKSVSDVDDKNIDTSSGIVISVTISSGGKHITSFGGESITIDIPVEGDYTVGESYNVVQISGNGSQQLLTGTCIKKDGKLFVRVITSHLSTFVLLDGMAVPFIDMDGHWALNAIRYAFGKNVMTGVASDKFEPEGTFSRAMLATMLYRLEGRPSVSGMNNPFSDVANGQWYTDAIIWAAKNNIVNGYGGGLFGPSDDISREQMATMLLRYSKYKKYDTSKTNSLAAFADAKNISAWALDGMKWANAEGLVTGHTASLLAPAGTATRAEAATLLMRFMTNIVK